MSKIILKVLSAFLTLLSLTSCTDADRYVTFSGYAQGGTYAVKANLKGVEVKVEEIRTHIFTLNLIIKKPGVLLQTIMKSKGISA
jgi:hypothetical protein